MPRGDPGASAQGQAFRNHRIGGFLRPVEEDLVLGTLARLTDFSIFLPDSLCSVPWGRPKSTRVPPRSRASRTSHHWCSTAVGLPGLAQAEPSAQVALPASLPPAHPPRPGCTSPSSLSGPPTTQAGETTHCPLLAADSAFHSLTRALTQQTLAERQLCTDHTEVNKGAQNPTILQFSFGAGRQESESKLLRSADRGQGSEETKPAQRAIKTTEVS